MDTITPEPMARKAFTDPVAAWAYISEIYRRNTGFIRDQLLSLTRGHVPKGRVRAFYPEVQVTSKSYGKTDYILQIHLIRDCWNEKPADRPSSETLCNILKVTALL